MGVFVGVNLLFGYTFMSGGTNDGKGPKGRDELRGKTIL